MNRPHSSYFIDEVTEFDSDISVSKTFSEEMDLVGRKCESVSRSVVSDSLQPLEL